MNSVRMHIGVDVGKDTLDICFPDGYKEKVRNIKSCRTKLIKRAAKLGAIISFEATGPYEEPLADECLAHGVKAIRLDAWGTRCYAKSQGLLEKTDEIDCEMIRDYAISLKESRLHYIRERPEAYKKLRKAMSMRKNLMKAAAIIYNQYENNPDAEMRKCLDRMLTRLNKQIECLETACDDAINSDDHMSNLFERFQDVKGVGPCTARAVLAYCPDIGKFNEKSIGKMCGNAPLENTSCTIKKKPKPKRGRSDLKKALYMAAISASKSNPILKDIYQRLVASGKPKKIALTAVARHIAIVLNYIAKYPDFRPRQAA